MKIDLSDKMLLAYLEGEVTQSQAAAIEAALVDAPADRRRLDRLRAMLGHLTGAPEDLDDVDLVPQVRQAITALPHRRRAIASSGRSWPRPRLLVTTSTLVAGGLLSDHAATSAEDPEFRVKSAQGPVSRRARTATAGSE